MSDKTADEHRTRTARFLASERGAELLAEAGIVFERGVPQHNALGRLAAMAARFLDDEAARPAAALAWIQSSLRRRAVEKLGEGIGRSILFDGDGLQMASGRDAADYHAGIVKQSGARLVVDMTAGIGIDAAAFAHAGVDVIAYERDPARGALLAANAARLGLGERISVRQEDSLQALAEASDQHLAGAVIYLDPPRRDESSRWGNADLGDQMIRFALSLAAAGVLAKLAPAAELGLAARHGGDLAFVSVEGECREALLRLGAARAQPQGAPRVSAVLLPGSAEIDAPAGSAPAAPVAAEVDRWSYLYEPDAAVIRAGLIGELAARLGFEQLDADVAYLLSDSLTPTPFATAYRIAQAAPLHRRTVQGWLDEVGAGRLIVKKRGVPDEPDEVRRWFKLRCGSGTAILALAKRGRQKWALLLERA